MKKITLSLLFTLLLYVPVTMLGQEMLRGVVKDIYNNPLNDVSITVREDGRRFRSDPQGQFVIPLTGKDEVLHLQLEKSEYYREEITIKTEKPPKTLEIILIPLKLLREEITVTALNTAEKSLTVPFAQSSVPQMQIAENHAESTVSALNSSPGVFFIGKGGIAVTPTIRGLGRRRILLMINHARITSDRSAGTSLSFIPPEFIERIEVFRSSAAVQYGSDAIGGVIHIITRDVSETNQPRLAFNLGAASASNRLNSGMSFNKKIGHWQMAAAVQAAHADDYTSPRGRVQDSNYSYYNGSLYLAHNTERSQFSLSLLYSAGRDIGKPSREITPDKSSFYPYENNALFRLFYQRANILPNTLLVVESFINPNQYELQKVKLADNSIEIAKNSATDFGWKTYLKKTWGQHLSLQFGVDFFGRRHVDMENQAQKNDRIISATFPVENGKRTDLGFFFTADYSGIKTLDVVAGARMGFFSRSALSDGNYLEKNSQAPAFFLGVTKQFGSAFVLFGNVGTAYRVPSLSEAFYTGITGRTSIVGNAQLEPESSINVDAGLKFYKKDLFVGAYLFRNRVDHLIEKFDLGNSIYTYRNLLRGIIQGLEIEFQWHGLPWLEFNGNYFIYHGQSSAAEDLNDVPQPKLFLGARLQPSRYWLEVDFHLCQKKSAPGPAEVPVDAYAVLDIKTGFYFSNRCFLNLKIANVLNHFYYPNADPETPPAKGMEISAALNYNF